MFVMYFRFCVQYTVQHTSRPHQQPGLIYSTLVQLLHTKTEAPSRTSPHSTGPQRGTLTTELWRDDTVDVSHRQDCRRVVAGSSFACILAQLRPDVKKRHFGVLSLNPSFSRQPPELSFKETFPIALGALQPLHFLKGKLNILRLLSTASFLQGHINVPLGSQKGTFVGFSLVSEKHINFGM